MLLDTHIIPHVHCSENTIFFMKMGADYLRYLTELSHGAARTQTLQECHSCYKKAWQQRTLLHPAHPIRLGLALNYCVFFDEIVSNASAAEQLAREAFLEAINEVETLSEEKFKVGTVTRVTRR